MEKNKSGGKGATLREGRKGSSSRKPVNTAGCTSAAGAQVEHRWSAAGAQLGRVSEDLPAAPTELENFPSPGVSG